VSHVYNPLIYARAGFQRYLEHCATGSKQVLLVGMNPGPWGMAQTGVPFGDPVCVKSWLKIEASIDRPPAMHPKRPVAGFNSRRREVSGQRVWGWAQKRFDTPARFFASFLVINYCPLVFMEASGRNRTPDKLPVAERKPLLDACDHALRQTAACLDAHWVIGIGNFAAQSVARALAGSSCHTGRITHPSPANPKANRGWATLIEQELTAMGLADLLP
jgi:single-strand selective monofunctional uracil DNA glycosylase